MMEIKIVSRWDMSKVLLCGQYESVKDCLEKNKGANLSSAYLRGADLRGANLRGANLRGADLRGADLRGANLRGANLSSADLRGADLYGAYLSSADLRGADLYGAYLRGVKNYYNSHEFALEIIRRQEVSYFTQVEWGVIGIISTHKLCWEDILKDYKKPCLSIFKKLAKLGYGEYLDKFKRGSDE